MAAVSAMLVTQSLGQQADLSRIYKAMDKGRRGEPVRIVVLGGSITAGSHATAETARWANIMTDWWKVKFPQSTVTLINAGIGGTGSDLGVFRLQRDVLNYSPDIVVVEYSVNDNSGGVYCETMMEGILRQLLACDQHPGVMLLTLKQENGMTAKESHKKVAAYYGVPVVRFADSIGTRLQRDGVALHDTYTDGIHPNNLGMKYIGTMFADELERVYASMPANSTVVPPFPALPSPMISGNYDYSALYDSNTLTATANSGWEVSNNGWNAHSEANEMSFELEGCAVSFVYTRHNTPNLGRVEAWVDDMPKKIFDGYWSDTWGPSNQFALVADGLPSGKHILHIRMLGTETAAGSDFFIRGIGSAGPRVH